jgi:hypothetical protein
MANKVTDDGSTSTDGGTVSADAVSDSTATADEAAVTDATTADVDPETFDPVGTLALILIYFAILAVAWVVMYFVEFLGNGPTVVG